MSRKILFVTMSSAVFEGQHPHPTGVWLSEFAEPYMAFLAHGAAMVVASPQGGQMPIDPRTNPTPEQEHQWAPALQAAASTLKLTEVSSQQFDAIFLPGGHGPMFDLPGNQDVARLLAEFFAEGKVISAVCHGPAGLVGAKRQNGEPLVKGVTLTSYTCAEEVAANLDKEVPFILESRLKELGANFIARENKADHMERDIQFITGQNPNSSVSVARSVIAALDKQFQPFLNTVGTELAPAETIAEFAVGTFIENIIVSETGEIFVSSLEEGKVYRVDQRAPVVVGEVEKAGGLAFDARHKLLVASSAGARAPGIYRLNADKVELIVPIPDAAFLNGLTHLTGDRYLVADSYKGLIWEVDVEAKTYREWVEHAALATNADPFHPVPRFFPGVNGIKLHDGHVYA